MATAGVLVDLLMATVNSLDVWAAAAGGTERGLRWRDEVTRRMTRAGTYEPYEELVARAAADLGLPASTAADLFRRWPAMAPWDDAAALDRLPVPWGFVTNCSSRLAHAAARASRLHPQLVLSAEEAGRWKPHPDVYREGCRRLGTDPPDTAFVAGSPYDATGAHRAGLQAWFIARRPDHRVADARIRVAESLDDIVSAVER